MTTNSRLQVISSWNDEGLPHIGKFEKVIREHHTVYVDPEIPLWFVPSPSGDKLLSEFRIGRSRVDGIDASIWPDSSYCNGCDGINTLLRSLRGPFVPPHNGRKHRQLEGLSELWFHLTDACNCRCRHCLFGDRSRPSAAMQPERVMALVEEGYDLGTRLICFTGGEPFTYPDFPVLLRRLLKREDLRVAVLTNALLLSDVLPEISSLDASRLHFQVSLDGPETLHDSIRGKGSFLKTCEALETMVAQGLPSSAAMAVNNENVVHMSELIGIVRDLGVDTVHFMWHFHRGSGKAISVLPLPVLLENFRSAAAVARSSGIVIDNIEAMKAQVFSHPGTRFDLGNAGWESLAIGPDESIYPTPAMVDLPQYRAGNARRGVAKVWRDSPLLKSIRNASLTDIPEMKDDPWRLIIGGGDLDHCAELNGETPETLILRDDPYRLLYREMALLAIEEALEGLPVPPHPGVILRMGDITTDCPSSKDVNFTHCNCLLSMGEGSTRGLVREFYTDRAATPDELILNPIQLPDDELAFIPDEAKARMYGCGSPIADAGLKKGETLVDLGSGTGVECFLASREVEAHGRVIGIDMTDAMLAIARRSQEHVHRSLGYENTEFHKGFLEALPLEDSTADVIISNCVVNLSHNKRRVFSEILRVLKPGGRLVISDVVAEEEPPLAVRGDHQFIGECVGGALVQDYLFSLLRDVGFVNADIMKRFPYRDVQGHRFYSLTFRAYKPRREDYAPIIYAGPFQAVITDDGQILPKGLPLEVNLGPGWDGDRLAHAGVFTLDARSGEITNVEAESSCACFISPSPDRHTVPESRPETGCLICGAPLNYREHNGTETCAVCGRNEQARAHCANGHYVCDACHVREPLEVTKRLCLAADDTDMFKLFYRITSHPTIPLHGPEYHSLVPGVVLSTYRNLGGPITDDQILEGIDRGALVPGGSCAFLGVCGAASGVGIAFSIMLDSNPLKSSPRQHVQRIVSAALVEISSLKAARCCRREAHLSFQVAARESIGLLDKELRAEQWLSCGQHELNKECIQRKCPFFRRTGQ
jgi:MoaA/NifB/PqqE/SkfB family radical SAM enzyme/SAM-dependent methyltransferase